MQLKMTASDGKSYDTDCLSVQGVYCLLDVLPSKQRRATRLWLDRMLIRSLGKCVDWSKIDKTDYLNAMKASPDDQAAIEKLISQALTGDFRNRELIIKGIDYSYYYEEVEE